MKAVIELASFQKFSDIHLTFLDQLTESIGIVLNTITATMRTEELLKQSQTLATELQTRQEELTQTNQRLQEQARTLQSSEERLRQQQEELQQTNEELEEKAELLSKQNMEVERKNREIQTAKLSLEEKAQQLAITSKYKSEFLANMSHELRTPLNSLLILSQLLSQNASGNLSSKQVEYATTIHSSGADLLALINEILDLTKIESGAMDVDVTEVKFTSIEDYVERNFRQVAQDRSLDFEIVRDGNLPNSMLTDLKRLHQVLRNLLSNAFKFTQQGKVTFTIANAIGGWSSSHAVLNCGSQRGSVCRDRYWHWHFSRQASGDLRSLPAGRWNHKPPVRRDRSGLVDQPGDRQFAGRRSSADGQCSRLGEHLYLVPADNIFLAKLWNPRAASPKTNSLSSPWSLPTPRCSGTLKTIANVLNRVIECS